MTDRKYSCQGCNRSDLTLTANGKVRSHAANGKRASASNPACGMGSEWPLESTEFHTHVFTYGDDENGHSGSFCACGLVESDDPEPYQGLPPAGPGQPDRPAPVPPNPFRDPLPGGVWDGAPRHPYVTGDQGVNAITPAGPVGADDFLDGSDDDLGDTEQAEDGRRYFQSRYDGTCITCLAHFDEGDMITRGPDDDGWEAQDCCGEGAAPRPEVPKAVARTLPVVRGRYKLPDPETGKPLSASRASKFAEGIADSYALDQWRHRMILVGLVRGPEILEKVSSALRDKDPIEVVRSHRSFLNDRAEEAMKAAGGSIRSGKGTTLHKYTEEVDGGTRALADVPEEYRPDTEAYVAALKDCGFKPITSLIERSVFCRELNVCGTFDRVLECVRDTEAVDLDGRPVVIKAGEFVIGDVKSGDNIESPWLEIMIQEAVYAHAINENGVAVQDVPGGPFRWVTPAELGAGPVREDVGIVMHVPYGQAEANLYYADLITGWRGAKICQQNRDFWKIKLPKQPVATFTAPDAPAEDTSPAVPDSVVVHPMSFEDHVTCACGSRWDSIEIANAYDHDYEACGPEKTEPVANNIMEAVHRAKHAAQEEVKKIVNDQSPITDPWEGRFRAVRTREAANEVWSEAKAAGLPAEEIKRLISLVILDGQKAQEAVSRPPEPAPVPVVAPAPETPPAPAQEQDGPSLTVRARAVTSKAQASAIFREMNDKIKDLPEEKQEAARAYRDKLVAIMKERLATPV